MPTRLRIGVSACLLGHSVRYDGGHKRHRAVTETLSRIFDVVAVCPEWEAGMGVPREPVELVGDPKEPRMIGKRSGTDWTETMRRHGRRRAAEIEKLEVSGFILKQGSPSCGLDSVPVQSGGADLAGRGMFARTARTARGGRRDAGVDLTGRGMFARTLAEALPLMPMEEEGRLDHAPLCENFVERVYAYRRWRNWIGGEASLGRLMDFHARHKLTLLAHSERHMRLLGRLLAKAGTAPLDRVTARYGSLFMEALKQPATTRTNANALQHMAGFLSGKLPVEGRRRLAGMVEDYRLGLVPLEVPLELMRRYATRYRVAYLLDQSYLDLHPLSAGQGRDHVRPAGPCRK